MKKPRRIKEEPPAPAETRQNLEQPEHAPAPPLATSISAPEEETLEPRPDGRRLRTTGRTAQFATRVHPDWKMRIYQVAKEDNLLLVEVLERALEAYERERVAKAKRVEKYKKEIAAR